MVRSGAGVEDEPSGSWRRTLGLLLDRTLFTKDVRNTMMTDPIADMLTRIRNAVRVERPQVEMPLSNVKRGLAEVLKREGYIWDWEEVSAEPVCQLRIHLKYGPNGERLIRHIQRVSKPGRRVYSKIRELPRVYAGLGVSILSTPKGVMADHEARSQNLGGEVLCRVF